MWEHFGARKGQGQRSSVSGQPWAGSTQGHGVTSNTGSPLLSVPCTGVAHGIPRSNQPPSTPSAPLC